MRWKQGRRGRLSSRHTDALSLYTCVLTGPQQLSCVTHGSPCLPCCLVPFSNPFPAQDVFTEAFLNPSERSLGPTAREVKRDATDTSSLTGLFGQQHCVLLSPNLLLQHFFFSVAFLPPWEIECNWLVQTCPRDSF